MTDTEVGQRVYEGGGAEETMRIRAQENARLIIPLSTVDMTRYIGHMLRNSSGPISESRQ
jgi:hypothetical protein